MNDHATLEAAFEALYRQSSDPWNFADSVYERSRYAATLDALSRPTYGRAFEPGCSIGVLTEALAGRCTHVSATDLSATAVRLAQRRCRHLANIDIFQSNLATRLPSGPFDLIVLSEIGYYFGIEQLRAIALSLAATLGSGGELIAVHWLGYSADHVLHGDTVHSVLRECLPCTWTQGTRHAGFRIDSWAAG